MIVSTQPLFLGSGSISRQTLLHDAGIVFTLAKQNADETHCNWGLPLQQLVESIAVYKMEHVILPLGSQGQTCFVLTADTLTQDDRGAIHGKPVDRVDALHKLKMVRDGARVGTAFCIEKKIFDHGAWKKQKCIVRFASAHCVFDVPNNWIEKYLSDQHGIGASGGMRIEGFGSLFLKSINGSYTAVVGLPMFELRQALEEIEFF